MIDQIFDEHFDALDESIKEEILYHYAHGRVEEAHNIRIRNKFYGKAEHCWQSGEQCSFLFLNAYSFCFQ